MTTVIETPAESMTDTLSPHAHLDLSLRASYGDMVATLLRAGLYSRFAPAVLKVMAYIPSHTRSYLRYLREAEDRQLLRLMQLSAAGHGTVLDILPSLSPIGFRFAQEHPDTQYYELNSLEVAQAKTKILRELYGSQMPSNWHSTPATIGELTQGNADDKMGEIDTAAYANSVLIVSHRLLQDLSENEKRQFGLFIREILAVNPSSSWLTPDISTHKRRNAALDLISPGLSAYANLTYPYTHLFSDAAEGAYFFDRLGLHITRHGLRDLPAIQGNYGGKDDTNIYRQLESNVVEYGYGWFAKAKRN